LVKQTRGSRLRGGVAGARRGDVLVSRGCWEASGEKGEKRNVSWGLELSRGN